MSSFLQDDDDQFSFDQQPKPQSYGGTVPTTAAGGSAMPSMPSFASMTGTQSLSETGVEMPSFASAMPGSEMPAPGGEAPSFASGQPGTDVAAPGATPGASPTPAAAAPQPAAPSGGTDHTELLTKLRGTTDPAQKAILQDQLGRSLFTSFKAAGHDVKWNGDKLIVDGRAYVLGDGNLPGAGGFAPGEPTPGSGAPGTGQAPVLDQPMPQSSGKMGAFPGSGWDEKKWNNPEHDSAKYIVGRHIAAIGDQMRAIPTAEGRKAFAEEQARTLVPQLEQAGWTVHEIVGQKMRISGHGSPPHWADFVGDIEGNRSTPAWTTDLAEAGGGPAPVEPPPGGGPATPAEPRSSDPAPGGGPGPGGPATPGWQPGQGPGYVPGDVGIGDIPDFSYEDLLDDMGMGPVATHDTDYAAGTISNNPADFGRVDEDYAAGAVSNDPLDTYSFEGLGDLGALGAGRTDAQTEDLVSQILANPESYPPHIVAMLKAQSKDELAEMQLSEDEDLRSLGYASGIQDSNWLASERLAAQGRRDQALVQSNRDIDLEAAARNKADRRDAAGVGLSYVDSKDSRNRGNRGQRFNEATASEGFEQDAVSSRNRASQFKREGEVTNESLRGSAYDRRTGAQRSNIDTRRAEAAFGREGELANEGLRGEAADRNLRAAQQNIANQFASAAEKRAAVALASDQSLKAAALRGDRIALRESLAQKAAELGIAKDKVMGDYLLGLMDDATRRHGIDVGASIDRAKISQMGEQWQEELAYKLAALAQNDRQFGAAHGLDTARWATDVDNEQYRRYAEDRASYEE